RNPSFSDYRVGAGLGLRFFSSFGPIRIDVATPLNPRMGDERVAVYVSIGQAF
ncbi:MAG: BamA/TamA family outer membrane protein, partial [Sphingomonadaceae bacterium]